MSQSEAWLEQIRVLQEILPPYSGTIYFEYSIPRLGKRVDVILVIGAVIFVIEFKVGECEFTSHAVDQVWDYALDLKNFHETSHDLHVAPLFVATMAREAPQCTTVISQGDRLLLPIKSTVAGLGKVLQEVLRSVDEPSIDVGQWEQGRYSPTPTIVEAAMALYNGHAVAEISRSDASAINLTDTSAAISEIIHSSQSIA